MKAGKPTSVPLIPAVNKYKAKTNEYVVSFVVIRDYLGTLAKL
jgi:hypothetical protein